MTRELSGRNFNLNFGQQKYVFKAANVIGVSAGYCFEGDKVYKESDFTRKLIDKYTKNQDSKNSWIPRNGHFAGVVLRDSDLVAFVDRVRSIPIFYGHNEESFFISDSAYWIKEKLNLNTFAPLEMDGFSLSGFVTGRDTLVPEIKQLQAGECLTVSFDNKFNLELHRYFKYLGDPQSNATNEGLLSLLDSVLINSFKRLISLAEGRTLVVPVSAGLDSRLVAMMLGRLNYENVICYSYGKVGNRESQRSQETAKKLGFRWIFIPYSRSLWRNWFNSNEFQQYMRFASNLCSVPHIQDWPAVLQMKTKGFIPDNSIFVPGHTGDFIAGGHIHPDFDENSTVDKNFLIGKLIRKHYRVNDFQSAPNLVQSAITQKIDSIISDMTLDTSEKAGFIYEFFDWQERQPKHVINALRIYEYFGYDWAIPLWDYEVIEFWKKVPFKLKLYKRLYKRYLREMNFGGVYDDLCYKENMMHHISANALKSCFFSRIILFKRKIHLALRFFVKQYFEYFYHELQWYGIYSYKKIAFKKKKFQNIYSFLVDTYLEQFRHSNDFVKKNTQRGEATLANVKREM